MNNTRIVVAGATGNLGEHLATALLERGATVRAIVRRSSAADKVQRLRQRGIEVVTAEPNDVSALTKACTGAACVVSALSGLRDVIVTAQTALLEAAVDAAVPRFIPSDFSIDYPKLPPGTNRNLGLRQEFHERIERASIKVTSILNGAFMDMLTGQAPFILFKRKRVLYWENPDQLMDFTTVGNTAAFTAAAALDPDTPRYLRIAGEAISARGLVTVCNEVFGEGFGLFRCGGLSRLQKLIKITRALSPSKGELYPAWQGMQYMHDMFGGRAKLDPLDNDRYPGLHWTKVRDLLAAYRAQ